MIFYCNHILLLVKIVPFFLMHAGALRITGAGTPIYFYKLLLFAVINPVLNCKIAFTGLPPNM